MSDYIEEETHLHQGGSHRRTFLRCFRASETVPRPIHAVLSAQDCSTSGACTANRESETPRSLRRTISVPSGVSTLCAQVSEGAVAAAVGASRGSYNNNNEYANSPPLPLMSHVPFASFSPLQQTSPLPTDTLASFPRASSGMSSATNSWCLLATTTTTTTTTTAARCDGFHDSILHGSSSGPTFQRILFAAQSSPGSQEDSALALRGQGKMLQLLHPLAAPPSYRPVADNLPSAASLPSLLNPAMTSGIPLRDVRNMWHTDSDEGYDLLNAVQDSPDVAGVMPVVTSQGAATRERTVTASPYAYVPSTEEMMLETDHTKTFRCSPNQDSRCLAESSAEWTEMPEASQSTKRWVNRVTRHRAHPFSDTSKSFLQTYKSFSDDDDEEHEGSNPNPSGAKCSPVTMQFTQVHSTPCGNRSESREMPSAYGRQRLACQGGFHCVVSPLSSQLSAASSSGAIGKKASPRNPQSSSTLSSSWVWKDDDRTQWTRLTLLTPTQRHSRSASHDASTRSEDGDAPSPRSSVGQASSSPWCSPAGSQSGKRQRAISASNMPRKRNWARTGEAASTVSDSEECASAAAGSEGQRSSTASPICTSTLTSQCASSRGAGSVEDALYVESPIPVQTTLFRSASVDSTSSAFTIVDPPSPDLQTYRAAGRRNTRPPAADSPLNLTANPENSHAPPSTEFDILWSSVDSTGFIAVERVRFSGSDVPLEGSQHSNGEDTHGADTDDNSSEHQLRSREADAAASSEELRSPSSPKASNKHGRGKVHRVHGWLQWYLSPTSSDGCGCFLCNHSRPQLLVSYLLGVLVSPPESLMHLMLPHMNFLFSEADTYCSKMCGGGRNKLIDMCPILPAHYLVCR